MSCLLAPIYATRPGTLRTLVGVARHDIEAAFKAEDAPDPGIQVAFLELNQPQTADATLSHIVAALRQMALQRHDRAPPAQTPAPLTAWWRRLARRPDLPAPAQAGIDQLIKLFAGIIAEDVLILIVSLPVRQPDVSAIIIHAMRRLAACGLAGVCLAAHLPREIPPFDWLAHDAVTIAPRDPPGLAVRTEALSLALLTQGQPAPASAVERRIHQLVTADPELRPCFQFNTTMVLDGGRFTPRPDLFCEAAKLVVELDGYADHGQKSAFLADRRRDYAFAAAGYLVLRIPNDDVLADPHAALEKIRTLLRMRRTPSKGGSA